MRRRCRLVDVRVNFAAMTTAPDEDSSVEQALTGGALQRVGWYRFYFGDERWEWSEEVERNPRIPTRHRHPHHRTCAVPQAPRRLPTHRRHPRRHRPNPQTLQHPPQDHHRARRRARYRRYRGTLPRQHRRNSWHTRPLSRRDPKRRPATRKHHRSPRRNCRPTEPPSNKPRAC